MTVIATDSSLIIVGLGSEFGVDRLGWEIISRLRASPPWPAQYHDSITLKRCETPVTGLIQQIRNYSRVIVVDAAVADSPPGTIYRLDSNELDRVETVFSSHGLGVSECLKLAHALGDMPARLRLIGLVVDQEDSEMPSEDLMKQLEQAIVEEALAMLS